MSVFFFTIFVFQVFLEFGIGEIILTRRVPTLIDGFQTTVKFSAIHEDKVKLHEGKMGKRVLITVTLSLLT